MKRLNLLLTLALMLVAPAWAPAWADSVADAGNAVTLAFRIKVSVPEKGKVRVIEVAPKVIVLNDKEAEIKVETPEDTAVTVFVRPTLGSKGQVTLVARVDARFGKTRVSRNLKMVTLLGSPALMEIEDERRGEKLSVEVTPTASAP